MDKEMLCTVIPAGLDEFFEEIGTPVAAGTFLPAPVWNEEELKKIIQLAEKRGQKLYPSNYLD